jgi:LPS sulfotransferase NodH
MRFLRPYLKRIALDTGIIRGNQKYVKFIILSRSRTGSEYLRSLLNSHREISVFGELFQLKDQINWHFPGYYGSRKQRAVLEENPVLFLEKEVFRTHPNHKKAVGFKIFYYHAQDGNHKSVWNILQNQKDLKVIHLKRKNILKTHLSKKRANNTGKWIKLTKENEEFEPIVLDYDECLYEFTKTRTWEEQYSTLFEGHDQLEVFYENLTKDTHNEVQRILKFLGVKEEELKSNTYKQSGQPISKAIANYFELKERFKGTLWEEFFYE